MFETLTVGCTAEDSRDCLAAPTAPPLGDHSAGRDQLDRFAAEM